MFICRTTKEGSLKSILYCYSDDDKPKRLSLRERMALKQQQEPKSVLKSPTRILDNPIKKYRQSREIEETVEIETTTRRRVIRFNDDGEEEVSIREKNLKNQTKEDVEREIARKSMTFEVSFCFFFRGIIAYDRIRPLDDACEIYYVVLPFII